MHKAFTATRLVVGCVVIYAAIFLHEDEEGKVQNTLEAWWIKLVDQRTTYLSKGAIFFQAIGRFSGDFFDRLFGEKLLSLQSVLVSCWLSAASILVSVEVLIFRNYGTAVILSGSLVHHPILYVPIPLLAALTPLILRKYWGKTIKLIWLCFTLIAAYVLIARLLHQMPIAGSTVTIYETLMLVGFLNVGFACDVAFVVLTRYLNGLLKKVTSLVSAIALLLCNFLIAALVTAPAAYPQKTVDVVGSYLGMPLAMENVFEVVISLASVTIALFALLHRLIWPVLERPLYAAGRYKLIQNKKLLWSIGTILCIGPGGWELAKHLIEKAV
jgi:hypothetical protein